MKFVCSIRIEKSERYNTCSLIKRIYFILLSNGYDWFTNIDLFKVTCPSLSVVESMADLVDVILGLLI